MAIGLCLTVLVLEKDSVRQSIELTVNNSWVYFNIFAEDTCSKVKREALESNGGEVIAEVVPIPKKEGNDLPRSSGWLLIAFVSI